MQFCLVYVTSLFYPSSDLVLSGQTYWAQKLGLCKSDTLTELILVC